MFMNAVCIRRVLGLRETLNTEQINGLVMYMFIPSNYCISEFQSFSVFLFQGVNKRCMFLIALFED